MEAAGESKYRPMNQALVTGAAVRESGDCQARDHQSNVRDWGKCDWNKACMHLERMDEEAFTRRGNEQFLSAESAFTLDYCGRLPS
ncbi:hypothetical protein NDU88_002125 [Pleurodeles waltl]|uniref:Uncharacterized protein n=1 Tax=Pleurodeles waltl TaxID=8319 RepID=A0AAV7SA01_PLEWA|nr:hypothetical protein NDU88_002125 [Pleurodeles waltl]